MRVHVTLKGSLAERLPGGAGEVHLPEGATVASLERVVGPAAPRCVVVVNGAVARPDAPLSEGDRVQVFPPMAGGSDPPGRPRPPLGAVGRGGRAADPPQMSKYR